tara:strand:+ start:1043 stop:1513 length:471 start_codon:yes stop_codon:yes gene_type:complete
MQKDVPTPRLRPATNADSAPVQKLVFNVLSEYGLAPDPYGTDADLANIESHYHQGWFAVLVVEEGVIGTVGLLPLRQGVMELRKMYLQKEWRGQGLGKLLLRKAVAKAKGRGAKKLVLGTADVLKEAVGLYRGEGFVLSIESHPAVRCNQTWELPL